MRYALLASILTAATACDKAKSFVRAGQASIPPTVGPGEALDLSSRPTVLFQIFGEADDPRMIPIAAIIDGRLRHIELTPHGWKNFNSIYLRKDTIYNVYSDGRASGTVRVKRGMWDNRDEPLYSLPGCQTLTPIASVALGSGIKTEFTVEFLAASAELGREHNGAPVPASEVTRVARQMAEEAGEAASITKRMLDSLDFHAVALRSAVDAEPTIIASFVDPRAENPTSPNVRTAQLLVIADREPSGGYRASYIHRLHGPLGSAQFRRYFDHLDLTGDGIDEIVLEGWEFGGDTFLSVLGQKEGRWREIFRSRPTWCLDERARQ